MKKKIRERVWELWHDAEDEMEKIEEELKYLKEHIKDRNVGGVIGGAAVIISHFESIADSMLIIEELKRLLMKEHENRD